jgi:hypothetical protein
VGGLKRKEKEEEQCDQLPFRVSQDNFVAKAFRHRHDAERLIVKTYATADDL